MQRGASLNRVSNYPVFKGPATLYVLRILPDGIAVVLTSSNSGARVRSAKEALPGAQQGRIDGQHDFIRKPISSSVDVSVELPERIRSGPSCDLMRRIRSTMSGPRPSNGPHSRLSGRLVNDASAARKFLGLAHAKPRITLAAQS
jgi:hypothetical protein